MLIRLDDFILGEAPFNNKCHKNSVQKFKEDKSQKVILCYAFDKGDYQCVHFINKNVDGKYVDNTWGWIYKYYDYYFIKEVSEDECDTIWDLLSDTKKSLINVNCNFIEKMIYGNENII